MGDYVIIPSCFIEQGAVNILKKQEFVDKCDTLLNSEVSIEEFIKLYFETYILTEDYDAMVIMYALLINKEILIRLNDYRDTYNIDSLPKHLNIQEGIELSKNLRCWQKSNEVELKSIQSRLIIILKEIYKSKRKPIPEGMIECISRIGNALIYSSMLHNDVFERDWYVVSILTSTKICQD